MPIHLECGARNVIAFVFSCPGREEERQGRPAAGKTGNNLEDVLRFMKSYNYYGTGNFKRDDWTRGNIRITNAWSRVEYKCSARKRTEATIPEILEENNISRLACELDDIEKVIVCCGEMAQMAVSCLYIRGCLHCTVKIVSLCHLGDQALNGWIPSRKLPECMQDPEDASNEEKKKLSRYRRLERIRQWADRLYDEIAAEQNNP